MTVTMFHDWEWYSDLDVTVHGTSRVSRHPSTTGLMCAYAFDDGPVEQWVPEEGQKMPADLRDALRDPDVTLRCWNKPAEYCTWTNVYGIATPHTRWRDTMVQAMSISLPGKLEKVPPILRMPVEQQKDRRGKALIGIFSKRNKATKNRPFTRRGWWSDPDQWEEFKEYNRQDVVTERGIFKRIKKYDMSEEEWENFHLDQEINEAGLPVNMNVVRNALRIIEGVTNVRLQEMRDITGLDNPNSGAQLLPWLRANGYPFLDLKKGHVKRALEMLDESIQSEWEAIEAQDYASVLERRAEVSRAAVKKYAALDASTDRESEDAPTGLLRYTLQFNGAQRTGRWAGRKYQAQNLARPADWLEKTQHEAIRDLEFLDVWGVEQLYAGKAPNGKRRSPMDLLATCVRPVVQAPPGYLLYDADLNAIENRVLGWLARDRKILSVFEKKQDPYVAFAVYMFGGTYDELYAEYKAGDKTKRTTAKPGVLGCGYMLGPGAEFENSQTGEIEATGLLGYAWNMGVKLTLEQSELSVRVWRETFKDAVNLWYALDKAMRRCIITGKPTECDRIRFEMCGAFLKMILPSGRPLWYLRPKIEMRRKPWGEMGETITYEGQNDKNQWVRLDTHPGKITENADQATARDLLVHAMRLAKREYGLDIRLHVHDQVVGLAREDEAEEHLRVLQQCLQERPRWAPDLPLGSEGFVSPIFVKD